MTSATPNFNVTGLSSGLDTNSIVQQLLAIDRQPEVRWAQQQAVEQARKSALADIKTRLQNLQTALATLTDTAAWGNKQSVTSSNTSVVGVSYSGTPPAGSWSFAVTQLATAEQWGQSTTLTAANANDTLNIAVGGGAAVGVAIAMGDSIDTIAAKINATANIGVTASEVNGKLYVSANQTDQTIAITSTGTLAADLGMTKIVAAAAAQYTVNGGATQTSATNTITNVVGGVTMTLAGPGTASVTIGSAAPDTAGISQKIQDFVTQYNSTVDFIYQKLTEAKVASPKSDADRTKGVLNGDPGLSALLSALRNAVSDPVGGQPTALSTLAQAGVSTGAAVGSGSLSSDSIEGKLTVDTVALSSQLASSFASVKSLFTNATGSYSTEGVMQRLNDLLTPQTQTGGVIDMRGQSEDALISDFDQRKTDLEARLTVREHALRSQFALMESTLSGLQSQGSWLGSQIAGLH